MQNLEKNNRVNFNSLKDALAMPGKTTVIEPLFGSALLAIANVLLYNEVSFFYQGQKDFSLIQAICHSPVQTREQADYIFSDTIDNQLLQLCKKGDFMNPEFSASLIFGCESFSVCKASIEGPGIAQKKIIDLPCNTDFIKIWQEKNSEYPLGVEVFFIDDQNNLLALSRTTKIEV